MPSSLDWHIGAKLVLYMPSFGQGRGVVGVDAPGLRLSLLLLLGMPKAATQQDIGLIDGARGSLDFGNAARAAVWEVTSTSGHAF